MKELIEALKKNEKPFGRLSSEERGFVNYLLGSNPECFLYFDGSNFMERESTCSFDTQKAYRIKADYNPEPEIVECKVYADKDNPGWVLFDYKNDEENSLGVCIDCKDWYGLKWSDGQQTGADDNVFRRWLNGKYEAPEFVLMREVQ